MSNWSPRQKRRRAVFVLAGVLTVLGLFSVVLGIAATVEFQWSTIHRLSAPIWSGIMIIAAGSTTAYAIQRNKHKHLFCFLLGVSVAGMTISFPQGVLSLSGLINDGNFGGEISLPKNYIAAKALHGICMVLGLVETLLSFSLAILASVGICDNGETPASTLERPNRESLRRSSGQTGSRTVTPAVVRIRLPTACRLYPPVQTCVSPPPYSEETTDIGPGPQTPYLQTLAIGDPPPPYQSRDNVSSV